MTNEWITQWRPTKEDEDGDGEVLILRFPDGRPSSLGFTRARVAAVHVGAGVPWKRTPTWQPPTTPKPEPEAPKPAQRPSLKVGQVWRKGSGCLMTVKSVDRDRFLVTDKDGFNWFYRPDGSGIWGESLSPGMDLIELVADAPAEPVTRKVPRLFAKPIRRTFSPAGRGMLDAFADDGTCWWMCDDEWRQIKPLPDREEPIDA